MSIISTDPANTDTEEPCVYVDEGDPADVDRYEQAEQEVADAKATATAAHAASEAADAAADQMRARLRQGDEAVTANHLCQADAERERTSLLAEHADRMAKRTERNALVRPVVAVAAAPILAEALACEVRIVDQMPSTIEEEPGRPYLLVRQPSKGVRDTRNGCLSTSSQGELSVQYVRSRLHREADWSAIATVARDRYLKVTAYSRASETNGDVARDYAVVDVSRVFEEPMVLRASQPDGMTAQAVGNRVAALVQKRGGDMTVANSSEIEVVSHSASGGKVVNRVRGITVAGLNAAAGWKPVDGTGAAMVEHLRNGITDTIGTPVAGIGRITKAEVKGITHKGQGVRVAEWVIEAHAVTPVKAAAR